MDNDDFAVIDVRMRPRNPSYVLTIVATLLLGWLAALRAVDVPNPKGKPNLILMLADDMGYADASCFGGKAVPTPNLDVLAKSGTKLTRFYAAAAVCTPTRASVLTGRYPLRFDIRTHFPDDESHLPRGVVTLPGLLRDAGYATAHVGKWHLGGSKSKGRNVEF